MSGSKKRYYWDACIYTAWLLQEPVHQAHLPAINAIAQENREGKNIIVTSVVTMMEVFKLDDTQENDLQNCFKFGSHELYEVDQPIIFKARSYRAHYNANPVDGKKLTPFDAIHLATAFVLTADEAHTLDDGKSGKGCSLLKLDGNVAGDKLKICYPNVPQGVLSLPSI